MKKRLELRFLPVAEEDVTEIIDYIAADNLSAAVKFYEALERRFEHLAANPHLGTKRSEPELKQAGYFSLIHGNCIIFYTLESNAVIIHRVLNSYRDYLRSFE